jgi:hypothetical protein
VVVRCSTNRKGRRELEIEMCSTDSSNTDFGVERNTYLLGSRNNKHENK